MKALAHLGHLKPKPLRGSWQDDNLLPDDGKSEMSNKNTEVRKMVKKFEIKPFSSWGRWELDGDGAEALKEAMASGLPFEIDFHGFTKVDHSLAVTRNEDLTYTIRVHGEMDDLYDGSLVYDAVDGSDEEWLTDDVINEIIADCEKCLFDNSATVEDTLEEDADLHDIEYAYYALCGSCQEILDENFTLVQDITRDIIDRKVRKVEA